MPKKTPFQTAFGETVGECIKACGGVADLNRRLYGLDKRAKWSDQTIHYWKAGRPISARNLEIFLALTPKIIRTKSGIGYFARKVQKAQAGAR